MVQMQSQVHNMNVKAFHVIKVHLSLITAFIYGQGCFAVLYVLLGAYISLFRYVNFIHNWNAI